MEANIWLPNNSLKPTRLAGENADEPSLPSSYRMEVPSLSRRAAELEAVRRLDERKRLPPDSQ